jgi:hypothetical protein
MPVAPARHPRNAFRHDEPARRLFANPLPPHRAAAMMRAESEAA